MPRVLILEDDAPLRRGMAAALRDVGHQICEAKDAGEARQMLDEDLPDLLVLDLVLPGESGLDLLRQLRGAARSRTLPVLVVSGQERVQDRILGLKTGADDYLVKPFDLQEFCARTEALLRRGTLRNPSGEMREEGILQSGGLLVDRGARRIWTGLRWVSLTPLEFQLFWTFLQAPRVPHSQEDLLRLVWHQPFGTGNPGLVRWAVNQLRRKIEEDPAVPRILVTLPRGGYAYDGPRLQTPEEADQTGPFHVPPDLPLALVTEAPVGILAVDPRGRCVFWNRRATELLGYARQEMLGTRVHHTLLFPRGRWVVERVAALLRGERNAAGAFPVELRRQDRSPVLLFLVLFAFSMKKRTFAAGILHDPVGASEGGVDGGEGAGESPLGGVPMGKGQRSVSDTGQ